VGAILCLHSVTTSGLPAEGTAHVSVDAFESYVRVARHVGEIVPLSELLQRRARGRSTAGLVAVTLDDAYAALGTELGEFLVHERVPIAVFVVSGAAAAGSAYWWDRIDDVFPRIPPARWRTFEEACGVPDDYRHGQPRSYGPLRPLRQWLLANYAGRWPEALEHELQSLETESGVRTCHRSMTFDEIEALSAKTDVEVGVHTVSHPVLPLLSDAELRDEILGCHAALQERFAGARPILSIPFGLYDDRTIRAARTAGMTACLTLRGTLVDARGDGYTLPRICLNQGDSAARLGLRLFGVTDRLRRWAGRDAARYPDLPSATT
jgi:peptidoglycan/xylan/chitin deacetylase (PgdA/CDA1 family)